ncbi:MAG: AbrB/MazE/SpoVT family DNA-binding domain-containing protein [Clostridia bacterium]
MRKAPKGKYAWTVKVGDKGQIVIPKEAREVFGIEPGDMLLMLGDEKQGIAIPPKAMFAKISAAIFGRDAAECADAAQEAEP